MAEEVGAVVLQLDTSTGFTAARARNAGLACLLQNNPDVDFVQFVDGDCEVAGGWIEAAVAALTSKDRLAAVCGRRREKYPERSIYNRLCDIEWDTPVGPARACGGDAMMRIEALQRVGGYNETIIAGEEPELCYRLRQHGWQVERVDREMTLHDADMHRFGQWWKRAVRGGHAYAEAAWRHGRGPERFGVRPTLSIWAWALVWPILVIGLAWPTGGWSLAGLLVYPLMVLKIAQANLERCGSWRWAMVYGGACVVGKWPQWQGQVLFLMRKLRSKPGRIIEYKSSTSTEGAS